MKNFKKLSSLLLAVMALSLAACGGEKAASTGGDNKAATEKTATEVPKEIEALVTQANETFDKTSNKVIKISARLDKSTNPATFIQELTMLELASDAPEAKAMKEGQEAATKQQMGTICSDPLAKELAKNNINYKIITLGKDGKEITSFALDITQCK